MWKLLRYCLICMLKVIASSFGSVTDITWRQGIIGIITLILSGLILLGVILHIGFINLKIRKILDRIHRSALQRALEQYDFLFRTWDACYQKDSCIEDCVFKKDDVTIVFREDLKEHIVNLYVIHPKRKMVKVDYRKVSLDENLIGSEEFKNMIAQLGNQNNIEQNEIDVYIGFLKANSILGVNGSPH